MNNLDHSRLEMRRANLDHFRLEMRRRRNKDLEKAGLIYMVSERDIEDFERINIDFSKRRVGDGSNFIYEKISRLVLNLFLLLFLLTMLSDLAKLRPGVLTILMSRVVPALVMLYILRELIIGGSRIYARSKAIEHDRLELIKRLNIARTKLPVVPHADANEEMNIASDCLNSICLRFATPDNILCNLETWVSCSIIIIVGVFPWYRFIWFEERT